MTESDSIKITKAQNLPGSYYGSCFAGGEIKEYVKIFDDSNSKNKEKKKDSFFAKNIKAYFDEIKKYGKQKTEKALVYILNAIKKAEKPVKNVQTRLLKTLQSVAKKAGLEACVSLGMLIVTLIFTACFCSVAYTVTLGGAQIGVVDDKSDFNALISEINAELTPYGECEFVLEGDLGFIPKLILKGDITQKSEIKERIKSTSADFVPAYSLLVDDVPVFALASEDMAKEVLKEYSEKFLEGTENAEMTFLNDVKVSHIFVPKTMLKTKESAKDMLLGGKHVHYTAKDGDSLSSVASENGITVESIMLTNTILNTEDIRGLDLKLYTGEPILGIKVVERVNEKEIIGHSTVTEEDNSKYEGTTYVKNEGKDGEKQVEAVVTMINGVVTKKDIISEKILSNPIERVEVIGTKTKPSPYGTGDFALPASGQLSSRFGSRWGRQHKGIDLAASEGTPIYAADNGTVIYSKYNDGGFGYLIEIDHANGYVTYYAHCSKLVAKEGDVVNKGDLIGYVGNTGRSTGAHLHFEVRKNGEPCDPLEFINE